MTSPDLEALAGRLSKAGKAAIRDAVWAGFGHGAGAMRAKGRPPTLGALHRAGLTHGQSGVLNETGLQLRAHLQQQERT